MKISMAPAAIPVARPSFGSEEEAAVVAALRSGWVSQGPKVVEFENAFAEYVSAPFAIAVSSCTTALHLALVASGIRHGDEVICPSLSFIATANAIVHAGAIPIFADVDSTTYNLNAESLEQTISPRTKAIVVVHQIGLPAPLADILELARARGFIVIEDAACAIGAEYQGARIGRPHTLMACFSFHPRKILTTGEGGMITTADQDVANRLRRLRQHGMTVSDLMRHSAKQVSVETYEEVGYNYRMTDLQASVGLVQLRRVEAMISKRRVLAQRYSRELRDIAWLIVPQEPIGCKHNYQSYMVRLAEDAPISRDKLMQVLLDAGIATRRGLMATHREPPYRSGQRDKSLPTTNLVAETGIILPLFQDMTEADQDYILDCLHRLGN
jgi:perosamine synthetase